MQGRRVMMFNRNEKDLDIFAHFFFFLGVDVYPMEKAKKKNYLDFVLGPL